MLQRFSSVAFGTGPGRIVTRNVVLPYGGAFVLLEGSQHLLGFLRIHVHLVSMVSVLSLGLSLLALSHSAELRGIALAGVRGTYRLARWIFREVPAWVLRLPPIPWLRNNHTFATCWRLGSRPLLMAATIGLVARLSGAPPIAAALLGLALFLALFPLWNSRVGQEVEETVGDVLARSWHRLLTDLIPGLFRLVMESFAQLVEAIDRALYTVDEWLRFRAGQGSGSLVLKAIFSPVWAVIAYVVRIAVNLLIEPQVNPVKHFPVVTVSHKVLLPILVAFRENVLIRVFPHSANAIFGAMQLLLPGFFGFLVWELKENWRLYEANRSRTVRPAVVGGHGETVARLLRPGFHSGTIPKLFARLPQGRPIHPPGRPQTLGAQTRSGARPCRGRNPPLFPARRPGLHPGHPPIWRPRPGSRSDPAGHHLHPRRDSPGGLVLSGPLGSPSSNAPRHLHAEISAPPWLEALPPEHRFPIDAALIGLYRMAGVETIRDLARETPPEPIPPMAWSTWVETWEVGRPEINPSLAPNPPARNPRNHPTLRT